MNTIPSVFSFKSSEVRTVIINDEPWFVAADVCAVLGVKNHRDALMHLDEDEKGVVSTDTLGGIQQINVINESGLYALVLRSRKPEAKPFIKWVTKEVLPTIRKTGRYEAAPYSVNPNDTLTKEQADTLRNLLAESAKQRFPEDTKKQGAFIMRGWSKLKAHFKVGYREIPAVEFTEAMSIATRHAVEGDYLPATEPEAMESLILDLLCKQRFSLSFIPLEHGLLKPQIHTHHVNAQTLVPQAVINDVRDRSFNFFPDALIPDLINAIGDRIAGANRSAV